jgi:hypothetical protein
MGNKDFKPMTGENAYNFNLTPVNQIGNGTFAE